ncbi:MAG: N-6 DNA methylase [Acidobacteria bacterium]|nr:N-6 DNA methylase [Acidobacteriota bacterium]MBI3655766.1 N-6 DNA methylase [Acidobacteriota bacterium]
MNRGQAYTLVRQTFTQGFEKVRFRNFAINLLNRMDESKASAWNRQYIKDAFKDHVSRYERLGTYTSPYNEKLDVLIVHLTSDSKLERARTALRNFVAHHLKTRDEKDAALVAFVSPTKKEWRFSYVKMEYATVEKESGKVGVETRLTPARRLSYIVGEGESCHTAQTRFLGLLQDTQTNPKLADIEEAFSVEAVTREFFKRYAQLFGDIHEALEKLVEMDNTIRDEFQAKGVHTVDFARKLMGQIVFLYFLQKKGWLGVAKGQDWGTGPHDFLRQLVGRASSLFSSKANRQDACSTINFFNDILEPLFYDTLATDRGHEAWCKRFQCRIPFLNGGLFEPSGGYDWRETDILLPNRLFTNTDFVEEGIIGAGVLDVFDRYNFTVNEAEPLEKEVAIDPEMLGKVFENLIEENRRKGLGAYYTPREIVHYMCQESLINYLDAAMQSSTGIPACALPETQKSNTGIPACALPETQKSNTGIPACALPETQTKMSVLPNDVTVTQRNLPHWTREGAIYWITFRLADSLPQEKLLAWKDERDIWRKHHPEPWNETDWKEHDEKFGQRLEQWLDAGHGSCALARADIRKVVKECLLKFEGERHRLHAAVIMPNHVHLVLEPLAAHDLSDLLKGIKGASARRANAILNTGGRFWMEESYDHIVRSEAQYQHFLRYVAENPIKANLRSDQYWLYTGIPDGALKGSTGIPACALPETQKSNTGIPACALPETQTRMSVLPSHADIEKLVHSGDQAAHYEAARMSGTKSYKPELPESIEKHARLIDEKLADITVCDPAVGSGAFLVGMMAEIVRARSALTPYFKGDTDILVCESLESDTDIPVCESLRAQTGMSVPRTSYHFKRHAIQNCLYGVDIDAGAVEIAKLRLWLSLVVDEEDVQQIKPLPNLDYKVVSGNSLIGFTFKSQGLQEIESLKAPFFEETDHDRKAALKQEIERKLRACFAPSKKSLGYEVNFDFEIYFSEIFHNGGGFDITLANPPYIFARDSVKKGLTEEDKKYFYKHFELAEYQVNLYPLFVEKGTRLLRPNGCLCFITPNNWLTINTNKTMRKFVLGQSDITVVNFYARVFESADVDSSIIIFKKSTDNLCVRLFECTDGFHFIKEVECDFFLKQREHVINIEAFKGDGVSETVQKIEANSRPLSQAADVKAGLKAYEVGKGSPPQTQAMKENRVYHSTKKVDASYIKYLDGQDVCRYVITWGGQYLKYGDNLAAPRKDFRLYSTKRILVRQIPAKPPYCIHACLVGETILNDLNSMNVINIREKPEYVLGVLNSRLVSWWFLHKFGKMQRATFPQFKVNELADFPLPKNGAKYRDEIAKLAGQILAAKKHDPKADTTALEREIDQLVYELYGLTENEIKLVEESVTK